MDEALRWFATLATAPVGGAVGWFFARRQRHVQTESSALDLYESALQVLEASQSEVSRMSADRERMRLDLDECVRARNQAGLERARDRVDLARVQQQLAEMVQAQATAARDHETQQQQRTNQGG